MILQKLTAFVCLFLCVLTARAQFATGALFDSARAAAVPESAPLMRGNYDLPASASLRAFCPIPRDQGSYGTCTAWSAAYASRTILLAQRKKISGDTINKLAFSPSYVYNQIRLTNDCSYGAYITDALDLLKSQGCANFRDFGYECTKPVTVKDKQNAKNYVIRDYKRLYVYDGKTKLISTPLKKALSEGKPIVISMRCWGSLEKAKDVWNPPTSGVDPNKGYHAVTVIGYDDNRYGGAFEIMNSWGPNWGNGGFTFIRYCDFEKNCVEAYEVSDFPADPQQPQQPAFSGELVFKKSDGALMNAKLEGNMYRMKEGYYSGTAFQFYVSHAEPIYLYVIGTDLSGNTTLLFPHDKSISPFLSYKSGSVAFPDEDNYVRLDNSKGSDFVCAIYSRKPLDVQAVMAKMKTLPGSALEKLNGALGLKVAQGIEYRTGSIGFKSTASIVPVVVEIKHN